MRERAHWTGSFALTDSLIFADVPPLTRLHQPPTPTYFPSINKISKPILFSLPLFLPPSRPPSSSSFFCSYQVPQLEVKSLAIPPSLALASPPFLISLQHFFSQHLPHSASCLTPSSSFLFPTHLMVTHVIFVTQMIVGFKAALLYSIQNQANMNCKWRSPLIFSNKCQHP